MNWHITLAYLTIACVNWGSIEPVNVLFNRPVSNPRIGNASLLAVAFAICSSVIICLLTLTGCVLRSSNTPLGGTRPLVKIGLAAPFEGLDRPLGYEALFGVKLALAERNATGGAGGYLVELVALNDFGEPDEARLQAGEFAADPAILGVVAGWSGDTAQAALPVYQDLTLTVVVPWSVPPELADLESGTVLVAADTRRTAEMLAQAVATTQPQRLAVVGDDESAAVYAQSMEASGLRAQIIPLTDPMDSGISEEWATREVKGQARPPDVLVLATDGALAGELLLSLDASDWVGSAFGGAEVGSAQLVDVAGDVAAGLIFVSPSPAGRDAPRTILDGSTLEKGQLGPRAVLAYDATHTLLDAIELAIQRDGHPSRQGVVSALPAVQHRGLTGPIAFDSDGRRVDAPVWLYNISNNNYPGQVLLSSQAEGE